MGEGGQYPSHPRPEPPTTSKKTYLDFDQDKNIAGQGKFLKPKRSELGGHTQTGSREGSTALSEGQHKRGSTHGVHRQSMSSMRQKDTWRCVARP